MKVTLERALPFWEDKIAEVTPVNFTAVYSGQLEESGFEAEYQGDGIWKAVRDVDLCRGDILRGK